MNPIPTHGDRGDRGRNPTGAASSPTRRPIGLLTAPTRAPDLRVPRRSSGSRSLPARRAALALLSVLGLGVTATAQPGVFVVDRNNGPGTHYTRLPDAVAAVPPGSVLIVRAGDHIGFRTSKPLHVLGEDGARIGATLLGGDAVIEDLPSGSSFSLRNFAFPGGTSIKVRLLRCAGTVLLEKLVADTSGGFGFAQGVAAEDCAQVVVRDCAFHTWLPLEAFRSSVLVDASTLRGKDAFFFPHAPFLASPGLRASGGATVWLSRCDVRGGDGGRDIGVFADDAPAIAVDGATLWIAAGATGNTLSAGQSSEPAPVPAIAGSATNGGVLELDPNVALIPHAGAPPIANVTTTITPLPSLHASGARRGGTVDVDLVTPAGDALLLFVGLPGPPIPLAALRGSVWLDPLTLVFVAAGTQGSTPFRVVVPVPDDPRLLGARFGWQAVAGNGTRGLRLSNPSLYVHY